MRSEQDNFTKKEKKFHFYPTPLPKYTGLSEHIFRSNETQPLEQILEMKEERKKKRTF